MSDNLTKERRSWNMSRIRSKDTKPELIVRRLLHSEGYRFRLHRKDLPGKPDIVLTKHKSIVLVHGCFWHRHKNCPDATLPKSRKAFWDDKLSRNVERDKVVESTLRRAGWKVVVIWECETTNPELILTRIEEAIKRK